MESKWAGMLVASLLGMMGGGGWWVILPYVGMVGRFCGDNHRFGDIQSDWVPILYLNTIRLTPSFCRKYQFVSITFSSRDTGINRVK